jgi:hypothetical protein
MIKRMDEEAKASFEEMYPQMEGLIKVQSTAIDDYLSSEDIGKGRKINTKIDDGYIKGYVTGKSMDINKGLNGESITSAKQLK